MSNAYIVVCGPPLPGRWMLARAIEQALGARRFPLHGAPEREEVARCLLRGEYVVVDGDLPTAAERAAILSIGRGVRCMCVEWRCNRSQADREIFHRYAARPRFLAETELARYLLDQQMRELADADRERLELVCVGADQSLDEQVAAVTTGLPRQADHKPDERRRVLIVEDDVEERLVLAEVLAELGWAVEIAPDAAVALALVESDPAIELVLSDHRMPGMTGVELARELWQRHPDVRSVLLTAFGDEIVCAGAVDAHAVTVLSKPVHILDLQRVLDEAVA